MLIPVIATEIEFYLFGSAGRDLTDFWANVHVACDAASIAIFKIEKERGEEQHEIALGFTRDIARIIADTNRLKEIVTECAEAYGMRADFSSKPVDNEPGNGLHIHAHLEDEQGNNLFYKDDHRMSEPLSHAIAGLLATMQENLFIFVPDDAAKKRLVPGGNAPTTISWGANNRTVAVRLPDKPHNNKHIEHRVSGADAEVEKVVEAVLRGMEFGITQRLMPPPQVYGDASLAMYGLPRLFPE